MQAALASAEGMGKRMGASRKPCLQDPARDRDTWTRTGAAVTGAAGAQGKGGSGGIPACLNSHTPRYVHTGI